MYRDVFIYNVTLDSAMHVSQFIVNNRYECVLGYGKHVIRLVSTMLMHTILVEKYDT